MDDPRLIKIAGLTEQIRAAGLALIQLRAERARISWSLIDDVRNRATVASVARAIGEPEIRFRKSIQTYRNGVPDFKRKPAG